MTRRITDPAGIAHLMSRHNQKWSRPGGADGNCFNASLRLMWTLHERGHDDARMLRAVGDGDHYGVLLDGTIYDLTARQFDTDVDFPLIEDALAWQKRMHGYIGALSFEVES